LLPLSFAEPTVNHHGPTCQHCKKEIQQDTPRWSAREPEKFWHYKCAEEAGLAVGDRFKAVVAARSHHAD
jgi:hypothetical protein